MAASKRQWEQIREAEMFEENRKHYHEWLIRQHDVNKRLNRGKREKRKNIPG